MKIDIQRIIKINHVFVIIVLFFSIYCLAKYFERVSILYIGSIFIVVYSHFVLRQFKRLIGLSGLGAFFIMKIHTKGVATKEDLQETGVEIEICEKING